MSTLYVDNLQPNLGSRVMAAGHVVQVVRNETTVSTTFSENSSSNAYVDVVSQAITPTATTSKIRVNISGVYYANHNANTTVLFRIRRNNETPTHNWAQSDWGQYLQYRDSAINSHIPVPFNYTIIDEPASTSVLTYKFDIWSQRQQARLYSGFSITLEEIAQ
jgi:hypothetical protein